MGIMRDLRVPVVQDEHMIPALYANQLRQFPGQCKTRTDQKVAQIHQREQVTGQDCEQVHQIFLPSRTTNRQTVAAHDPLAATWRKLLQSDALERQARFSFTHFVDGFRAAVESLLMTRGTGGCHRHANDYGKGMETWAAPCRFKHSESHMFNKTSRRRPERGRQTRAGVQHNPRQERNADKQSLS